MNTGVLGFLLLLLIGLPVAIFTKVGQLVSEQAHLDTIQADKLLQRNAMELTRAELIAILHQEKLMPNAVLEEIRCATTSKCAGSRPAWADYLVSSHSPSGLSSSSGRLPKVQVIGASRADDGAQYFLDLGISLEDDERSASVAAKRAVRLRMGQSSMFSNAIIGNSNADILKHATVFGNVGEYQDHHGVFAKTRVHGKWFSAGLEDLWGINTHRFKLLWAMDPRLPVEPDPGGDSDAISNDYLGPSADLSIPSDCDLLATPLEYDCPGCPAKSNSACPGSKPSLGYTTSTYFVRDFEAGYTGSALPWNPQRRKLMLPKFDPDSMMFLGHGNLRGSLMKGVPYGALSSVEPTTVPGNRINGIYDGNVILNGRDGGPLEIDGNVFVRGDIIIFGKVQGRGNLFAGRNIYVVDDLSYVNSPTEFDDSAPSNQILSVMGQSDTARKAVAESMLAQKADQLGLFAANNIIIGDPFPENSTDPQNLTYDMRYIHKNRLAAIAWNNLAMNRRTGRLLDYEWNNDSSSDCFLDPWQSMESCKAASDPNVMRLKVRKYFDDNRAGTAPKDWYDDAAASTMTEGYANLSLPANVSSDLSLQPWITPARFLGETANLPEQANSESLTGNLRRRFKDLEISMPGTNPYSPDTWDIPALENAVEDQIGLRTVLSGEGIGWVGGSTYDPAMGDIDRYNRSPGPPRNLWATVQSFLNNCRSAAIGEGSSPARRLDRSKVEGGSIRADWANWPWTGFVGLNHLNYGNWMSYRTLGSLTPLKSNGSNIMFTVGGVPTPQSLFIADVECHLWYDRKNSYDPPKIGPSYKFYNRAARGGQSISLVFLSGGRRNPDNPRPNPDYAGASNRAINMWEPGSAVIPVCSDFATTTGHGLPAIETCQRKSDGTPVKLAFDGNWDERLRYDDDLHIEISTVGGGVGPSIRISTRFWDASRFRKRNRISKIQAFLFANHFITYADDSSADRQLRIDGGIIAKDFLGHFLNKLGSDRTYPPINPIIQTPRQTAASHRSGEHGVMVSLILKQDPRFEFNTELVYKDFGSVMLER